MFDSGEAKEEMRLHEKECPGELEPHERFDKGGKVKMSELGKKRLNVDERKGVVASKPRKGKEGVSVIWNENKSGIYYYHLFISNIDKEGDGQ